MPKFDTENNCHLNYEVYEPANVPHVVNLVLVHGYFGDLDEWRGYSRLLGKNVRIVAVDIYCHGKSSWVHPPNAHNEDLEAARDIILLTKHLSLGKYFVAGHSFGGRISGLIAAQDQDNVVGAVLITPVPLKGMTPAHLQYFLPPTTKALTVRTIAAITAAATELNDGFPMRANEAAIFFAGVLRSSTQEGHNSEARAPGFSTDRTAIISQLKCPVLFLVGDRDAFFKETLEELSLFVNVKPNLHCLYDVGHMLVSENTLEVAVVLASFIAKH
jgi:pimeloyl-ACP methyl ester carboxylesterase